MMNETEVTPCGERRVVNFPGEKEPWVYLCINEAGHAGAHYWDPMSS